VTLSVFEGYRLNRPDVPVIAWSPPGLYDQPQPTRSREKALDEDVAKLEQRLAANESLRLGEVATLAGRGRSTIQDWISTGKWKPRYTRTLGGQRRFHADDVRALLAMARELHGGGEPAPGPDGGQDQGQEP
jgi:excisionase family DNA binding protein